MSRSGQHLRIPYCIVNSIRTKIFSYVLLMYRYRVFELFVDCMNFYYAVRVIEYKQCDAVNNTFKLRKPYITHTIRFFIIYYTAQCQMRIDILEFISVKI